MKTVRYVWLSPQSSSALLLITFRTKLYTHFPCLTKLQEHKLVIYNKDSVNIQSWRRLEHKQHSALSRMSNINAPGKSSSIYCRKRLGAMCFLTPSCQQNICIYDLSHFCSSVPKILLGMRESPVLFTRLCRKKTETKSLKI